ncbi:Glutamate-gated chloride channel-like 10, partial [Homarus americanus]
VTENDAWETAVFDFSPLKDNKNKIAKIEGEYEDDTVLAPPYTLCCWVLPLLQQATGLIVHIYDNENSLEIKLLEGRLGVSINNTCSVILDTPELESHKWHQLCLAVNDTGSVLYLANHTFDFLFADKKICFTSTKDVDRVTLQLGSYPGGFVFSGKLARVLLYTRELNVSEITQHQQCQPGPLDFQRVLNVSHIGGVERQSRALEEFCRPHPSEFIALFRAYNHHYEARAFCKRMGGRLINRSDDYKQIAHEISSSKDIVDLKVLFWTEDMVYNSNKYGIVLSVTRADEIYHTLEFKCSSILIVTACFLPYGIKVYVKGDDVMEFSALPYNGQLILQSKDGAIISKSKCPNDTATNNECLKSSICDYEMYAHFLDNQLYLGRKDWFTPNMMAKKTYTLSLCSNDSFTCNDSSCIPLINRCDGIVQCPDHSDEGDICYILEQPSSTYWKSACPEESPLINLKVRLLGVNTVSLQGNEFGVTLYITLSWTDHRLKFINLANNMLPLEPEEFDLIWSPVVYFDNAVYRDNLNILKKIDVLQDITVSAVRDSETTIDNSYEVQKVNGSHVFINQHFKYLFTFSCTFELFTFPFDTQECQMSLRLKCTSGCQPKWNSESDEGIQVEGKDLTISTYSISQPRFTYDVSEENAPTEVIVYVLFTRKFIAYLLTTFLPCIVLCILSHLTLTHFQLDNFTDRITVTLSLLIVIASLFSQVSSSLPSGPMPKLVDFFFFYCILRVSFVFFLHSCIQKSLTGRQETPDSADTITMKDPSLDINVKVAWVSDVTKHRPTRRFNTPQIINRLGIVSVLLCDVTITCLFAYWAISEQIEKDDRFSTYNYTKKD